MITISILQFFKFPIFQAVINARSRKIRTQNFEIFQKNCLLIIQTHIQTFLDLSRIFEQLNQLTLVCTNFYN